MVTPSHASLVHISTPCPNPLSSKIQVKDLEECLTTAAFGRKGKRDLTIMTLQDFLLVKKFIHEP